MLPASPHADGTGRSTGPARQTTPCLNASPPPGVDGMTRQVGAMLSRPLPYLCASPFTGVDGGLRRGGDRLQFTTLPAGSDPSLFSAAPSWARVVRDRTSITSQPPHPQSTLSPKEDFLRLYKLCVANGFTARVAIRSAAGNQEITLSCRLRAPSTSMTAQVSRWRRWRRQRRWNTNVGDVANHLAVATPAPIAPSVSEPSPPKPSGPEHLPLVHPPPEPSLPRYSPIPSPPPAKRMRKAVKRRCKAELLRGEGDTLLLFPLHGSPLPSALSVQQQLVSSPLPDTPPISLPPGPSSPIRTTPEPLSPTTAPADFFTPPPTALAPQSASAPQSAPEAAKIEDAEPVQCLATTDGPPPPPRWPEPYVFSTDPDRIICRKCCKRHYNFRWYSHCFMCHMDESRG